MTFVYQHYAPMNLASFIQRKGRGGRGLDDRPIAGITLSAYSPRDSWYFRRPHRMLDASRFAIPLNMSNHFVRRGQAVSAVLDALARWKARNPTATLARRGPRGIEVASAALGDADEQLRQIFGSSIFTELAVPGMAELWQAISRHETGAADLLQAPRRWYGI